MPQSFEGEVFALGRDEHAGRGGEGVESEQPEGWWAVDDHAFDCIGHRCDRLAQSGLAFVERCELDLGAGEIDVRGHEAQQRHCGLHHHFVHRGIASEELVDGAAHSRRIESEAGGGVGLGVEIDEQHGMAELRQRGAEVDGGGRLADAPLLVDDGEDGCPGGSQHLGVRANYRCYIWGHSAEL